MAIGFGVATASGVTAGAGRTGNGNLIIPLPSGWAIGQLAIILLYSDQGSGSVPTNWTQVSGSPWGSATPKLQAFIKFLAAGEPNPVTTISGSTTNMSHVAAIATYDNVDTSTPVEVIGIASVGTGTPMTAGSINTLTDGAYAIGLCGRGDNESSGTQTFGGSAIGVTERFDSGTNQGDDSQVSLYDKLISSHGPTGAGSAITSVTDPWVSVLIAIKPLAAPLVNGSGGVSFIVSALASAGKLIFNFSGGIIYQTSQALGLGSQNFISSGSVVFPVNFLQGIGNQKFMGSGSILSPVLALCGVGNVSINGFEGNGGIIFSASQLSGVGGQKFIANGGGSFNGSIITGVGTVSIYEIIGTGGMTLPVSAIYVEGINGHLYNGIKQFPGGFW